MSPLISIITPCYNSYRYMRRYFQGLERQTYKNFEIIIIDDCSTDDSYTQIQKYINSSKLDIKLLKTENNSGPGEARNIGIKYAKGKWLAFCDSDDWYDERFLEIMYTTVVSKNADIVMCNYRKVFDNRKPEDVNYLSIMRTFDKKEYLAQSKASLCLMLYKKKLFEEFELPKLYNGEDMAAIPILLARANKIVSIQNVIYNYYIRGKSVSNNPSKAIVGSMMKAFEMIENGIDKSCFHDEIEFIGIKIILYGATLNGFKSDMEQNEIKKIIDEFIDKYPAWQSNPYLKGLGYIKRVYLKMIKKQLLFCNYIMAKTHLLYTSTQ